LSKASEESLDGIARHLKSYGDDFVGVFANFGDEAVESVTKYSDDAISAMKNGIEPKLISSLDELGVNPSKFTDYGITSKSVAETTETLVTS